MVLRSLLLSSGSVLKLLLVPCEVSETGNSPVLVVGMHRHISLLSVQRVGPHPQLRSRKSKEA